MHKSLKIFAFIFSSIVLLQGCGWNDFEEVETVTDEFDNAVEEDKDYANLEDYQLRSLGASSFQVNQNLSSKIAEWSMENGFSWTSGFDHRDMGEINFYLKKHKNGIKLNMSFYLEQKEAFPTVYDHNFGKRDDADYLAVDIVLKNKNSGKILKLSDRTSIFSSSWSASGIDFNLNLTDLHEVPAGLADFSLTIKTTFESFFGVRSKEHPVSASIDFQYDMPALYYTDIYFKILKLNKEMVRKRLGSGNDFNNPDPETGIRISYNGDAVLFTNTKNSFKLHSNKKERFYHLSKDDQVEIDLLDIDYGFNGNDYIHDTTVYLKDIESNSYLHIPMKYAEELLLYAKFGGKANF